MLIITIGIALQKDIPQRVSSKYCQVKIQILEKIRVLLMYHLLSGYLITQIQNSCEIFSERAQAYRMSSCRVKLISAMVRKKNSPHQALSGSNTLVSTH